MKYDSKFKNKKKLPIYFNKLYPVLLMCASLFMGIAYAAINSVGLNIIGDAVALLQSNLYLHSFNYVSDVNAVVDRFSIRGVSDTVVSGTVVLSDIDPNSSITYNISIYNSTDSDYYFTGVDYLDDISTYSNPDIIFSLTNINEGDVLSSKDFINFNITFSYKNGVLPTNNELNFYLNFVFKRKFNVSYVGFDNSSLYPMEVYENDSLIIDFSNDSFDELSLLMNDTVFDDYSYVNGILTVSNVSGNLVITAVVNSDEGIVPDDGVIDKPIIDGDVVIFDDRNGSTVNVKDMLNIKVNGTNASSKIINRIDVNVTYSSSTGSKQALISKLTHNGVSVEQELSFAGNMTNHTVTITFDNLQILPNDVFSVVNSTKKVTNGSIEIVSENMVIYFDE